MYSTFLLWFCFRLLTRLSVRLTVTAVALLRVGFDALYCRLCRIFSKYRCRLVTYYSCTRISFCPLCETKRESSSLSSFVIASALRPRVRLVLSNPSTPFGRGSCSSALAYRSYVAYGSRALDTSSAVIRIIRYLDAFLFLLKKYESNIYI